MAEKKTAEVSAKPQPRRLMIALSPASTKLLRDIAAKTKIPQTELLEYLELDGAVRNAAEAALVDRWRKWREEQLQDDFLKDRMPAEKP